MSSATARNGGPDRAWPTLVGYLAAQVDARERALGGRNFVPVILYIFMLCRVYPCVVQALL